MIYIFCPTSCGRVLFTFGVSTRRKGLGKQFAKNLRSAGSREKWRAQITCRRLSPGNREWNSTFETNTLYVSLRLHTKVILPSYFAYAEEIDFRGGTVSTLPSS